jgi:hypothetical protein
MMIHDFSDIGKQEVEEMMKGLLSVIQNESIPGHGQFPVTGGALCHSVLNSCAKRFFTMRTGI